MIKYCIVNDTQIYQYLVNIRLHENKNAPWENISDNCAFFCKNFATSKLSRFHLSQKIMGPGNRSNPNIFNTEIDIAFHVLSVLVSWHHTFGAVWFSSPNNYHFPIFKQLIFFLIAQETSIKATLILKLHWVKTALKSVLNFTICSKFKSSQKRPKHRLKYCLKKGCGAFNLGVQSFKMWKYIFTIKIKLLIFENDFLFIKLVY